MKKYLILIYVGLCFSTQNYSQIIFQENFDNICTSGCGGGAGTYTFPSGWLLRNVDNGAPAGSVAYVNDAWERREDFSFNSSDSCAFSTSWYNPAGTSNDWMWTPLIGPLPANTVLSWNAVTYDGLYPDGYEVRVMTSASGPPTGGTGVIGNQITNSTTIFSTAAEATAWTNHQVNLAAYTGQSIYIGFRNNSNDKFLLLIDDVQLEVIINYDAQLLQVDTLTEYTKIPKSQVSPLSLEGDIRSNGAMSITNVALHVMVYDPAMTTILDVTSPTLPALAPGITSTFNAGTWTPPGVPGIYTLKFFPELTESDGISANDTITRYVVVDDTTYSRDDELATGGLGIGAGNGGFLGNEFAINDTARLAAVKIYYTAGYPGEKLAAVIWDMSGGFPNTIVGYTDTLLYTTAGPLEYRMPMYGGDLTILPGNYVITAIEFDSTLQVGLANNLFTPNRTWVDWPTSPISPWANNEDFGAGFAKSYMIRGIIKPSCPSDIITGVLVTPAGCSLTDGAATVNTIGSGPFSYNWSSGGTAAVETGLGAGSYWVIVTDNYSGCTETDSVVIINPGAPTIDSIVVSDPLCFNDANGSATVFASGGTLSYNYLWTSGGTLSTETGLTSGNYTVTITDGANCVTQSSTMLNNPTIVGSSVIGSDESCAGCNDGSATVTPSGGTGSYSYNWAPSGGAGPTATGLSPGVYTVTVTDDNGCTSTSTVTINAFSGIENLISLNSTQVYPNPSTGSINIKGKLDFTGEIKIDFMSVLGEVMLQRSVLVDQELNINLDVMVSPGSYLIRISAGDYKTTKSIIIQ